MSVEPLESRVERFLVELEQPVPLKDRCAHAIANQRDLVALIRELLEYLGGHREAHLKLAVKATRLCVALQPLLTRSRAGRRDFIDEAIEGTAPKLRAAVAELRAELGATT